MHIRDVGYLILYVMGTPLIRVTGELWGISDETHSRDMSLNYVLSPKTMEKSKHAWLRSMDYEVHVKLWRGSNHS